MAGEGTWIDWQYLWDAARLLKRCRYTLQYTYPFAYYMDVGPRKELFEYQQVCIDVNFILYLLKSLKYSSIVCII